MDERLNVSGQRSEETSKRREKWLSLGFHDILGNQKENSDSCLGTKNYKKHLRIRETNEGLGLACFKGEPQISLSDLCFADSEVCSNWVCHIEDYLSLLELKCVKSYMYISLN